MKNDEYFMQKALLEAKKSRERKEVPVGAVLVSGNMVFGCSHNQPIARNDPTAHAEIVVIREACSKRKSYRLPDCDLYVTLEPCAMCLSAAVHARIRRLVFGAYDPKGGAVESIMKFPFEKTNHRIKIKGGILADECGRILTEFFSEKRGS